MTSEQYQQHIMDQYHNSMITFVVDDMHQEETMLAQLVDVTISKDDVCIFIVKKSSEYHELRSDEWMIGREESWPTAD